MQAATPAVEYARRLESSRAAAERLARVGGLVSNLRLAVFAIGLVLAWPTLGSQVLAPGWLVPPILSFVGLVVWHDRLIRSRGREERRVAFYERGLARLEDRWAGSGESGERFRDPHHPYTEDLDLFGSGSLFELLCTARTSSGEAALAARLQAPADPPQVRARQEAAEELRPRLDLREDLALLGEDVQAGLHADALGRWGEAKPVLQGRAWRVGGALCAALSVGTLAVWVLAGIGPLPFLAALLLQSLFCLPLRARVKQVIDAVDLPGRDLALLAEVLARIEAERFSAPELVRLRQALDTGGVPPSRRTASLRRLIDLLDARRNQLFAPIGALLLWTTQLAFAIEAWRAACGPRIAAWIEAVGEIEALAAVGGYAYEHPDQPFAELVELAPGETLFEAEGLGHPLLPADQRVRNDVVLGGVLQVLVVSGSNMSGKSTLLRSVGTNAVLAFAGVPVCASRLRLCPVAVGASIRIQDSLQEGSSRFYAEIRRLRQVMELAERRGPALFLIDEILHGTNSHDRGIGAEAVVRGLVERGAIGLVTTHDLALARVAETLAPRAANVHFQDHMEDAAIAFDYRLRAGVVTKSNALALMRSVGLEV